MGYAPIRAVGRVLLSVAMLAAAGPWDASAGDPDGVKPPPSREGTFSVATYNVNWGNVDLRDTVATIRKAGADLVLLQETNAESEAYLRRQLRGAYRYMLFHGHRGQLGAERFGILSKQPVNKLRFMPPKHGLFGFWIGQTELAGRKVQIVNVHLDPVRLPARGAILSLAKAFADLEATHKREIEYIQQSLTPDLPTLIAGDFNSMASGVAPQSLMKKGFADSFASVTDKADQHPTGRWRFGRTEFAARIDYIFHTGQFSTAESRIVENASSDHALLVSRLRWHEKAAGEGDRPASAPP